MISGSTRVAIGNSMDEAPAYVALRGQSGQAAQKVGNTTVGAFITRIVFFGLGKYR